MLTKLSVKNFRLLRSVELDFEPGKPVVLIGPNSSGKTSVLEVLELLRRCSSEENLREALAPSGGSRSVCTAGSKEELQVEVHLKVPDSSFLSARYGFSLQISQVRGEWLFEHREDGLAQLLSRGVGDFSARDRSTSNQEWILNEKTQEKDPLPALPHQLVIQGLKQPEYYPSLGWFTEHLQDIAVYGGFITAPMWLLDPREHGLTPLEGSVMLAPQSRIDRRGLDLVNALYALHTNHEAEWKELIRAFYAEFPFVSRFEFPADPAGGRIALAWRDHRYPGERMYGHQMSMGMVSYLCLLAAVLYPGPAPVLAFDEPDAHLHPSAMRRLVRLLERASEESAVLVATHSDRFLDFLSDPAASLRICEPTKDGVTIRRLDPGALEEWRKDYSLSQLRERGHLDPANTDGSEP